MSATPQIECQQIHPSLAVPDVLAAADFYSTMLGFRLAFTWGDPPAIAGLNLRRVQMFLERATSNPQGCRCASRNASPPCSTISPPASA